MVIRTKGADLAPLDFFLGVMRDPEAAKSKTSAKAAKSVKADEAEDSGKLDKISQLAGHRIGIVTGNEASANGPSRKVRHRASSSPDNGSSPGSGAWTRATPGSGGRALFSDR
jgi:hypothetical protein